MIQENKHRGFWQSPWKSAEAFACVGSLLTVGFAIEFASGGSGFLFPTWPLNLILGAGFVSVIIGLHVFAKKTELVAFLASIPNAVVVILAYLLLVIVMGSLVQQDEAVGENLRRFGLSHLTRSWPFLLINIYFLLSLGLVIQRRFLPFSGRNVGFFVSHCGLWWAVFSGGLGAGDIQKLQMEISTEATHPNWVAHDEIGNETELPFAIQLHNFSIEEYPPRFALINNKTGVIQHRNGLGMILIEPYAEGQLEGWHCKLLNFLPEAGEIGNVFYKVNEIGSPPAANIEVKSATKTDTVWISCGSYAHLPVSAKLDSAFSLVMTVPEPKRYSSYVSIYTPNGNRIQTEIEVNKAVTVNGWKIYQLDFDKRYGKWSQTSVLEIVRDPWLWSVYIGIFLMLAGVLYLFWHGRKSGIEAKKTSDIDK